MPRTTDNLLFRINVKANSELSDDKVIEECMEKLKAAYPMVAGYHFERESPEVIQLLIWFSEPIEVSE